jgi:serine/threonine-protein kinase
MIGPDRQLRILDFGIGCLVAEMQDESLMDTRSTANAISSGLDCACPESIMDPTNLTPVGDQYSLGCVLYFCLTGRFPFAEGTSVDKMMGHQLKEPPPIKNLAPQTPDGLIAVVTRLMKKAPEERYASAGEAAEALRPFATTPRAVAPKIDAAPTETGPVPAAATPLPPTRPVEKPLPAAAPAPPVVAPATPAYTAPAVPQAWKPPTEPVVELPPLAPSPRSEGLPARPSLSRTLPRLQPKPEPERDWSVVFYILLIVSIVAGWLLARSGILF